MVHVKEDAQLQKAMKRVKIADRFRLFFLFATLLMVLFIFYGNKFAEEAAWFETVRSYLYVAAFYCILGMLISSVTKIFLAAAYNRLIKTKK